MIFPSHYSQFAGLDSDNDTEHIRMERVLGSIPRISIFLLFFSSKEGLRINLSALWEVPG